MQEVVKRLRALADEAYLEYSDNYANGGELPYPHWADDLRMLCAEYEKLSESKSR